MEILALNKNIDSKASLIVDLTGRQLREIFHASDKEWDEIILPRHITANFFEWPASYTLNLLLGIDVLDKNKYWVGGKKATGNFENDKFEPLYLSGSLWTTVRDYISALTIVKTFCIRRFPDEEKLFNNFLEASQSFHLPRRIKTYEDGIEVGTRESEVNFGVESHLIFDPVKDAAFPDLSDVHDDPGELQRVERFSDWFRRKTTEELNSIRVQKVSPAQPDFIPEPL